MSRPREASPESARRIERIFALLAGTAPEGGPRFSDEDLSEFLPFFVLNLARVHDLSLPPNIERHLGEFAIRIELDPASSPEETWGQVSEYYADNPVNPELVRALNELLGEFVIGDGEAAGRAARSWLGQREGLPTAKPAPAGLTRSGPLARFQLEAPSKRAAKHQPAGSKS